MGHVHRGRVVSEETKKKVRASLLSAVYPEKWCTVCGNRFRPRHSVNLTCSPKCAELRHKDERLKHYYGMQHGDYGVLVGKQEGMCAICQTVLDRAKYTHIDHCHKSGKVRGLLCNNCNNAIGHLRDDPVAIRAAANYVEYHALQSSTPQRQKAS
jgi:predicted nucleic acid-binding Zn ribbon protein